MVLSGVEVLVPDRAGWRAWLEEHHDDQPAAWVILTKKGGTVTALGYEDAVLEALCFGWIDGQGRGRDAETTYIRFTPRGPRSKWSISNVRRVATLEAEGLMTDAGRAVVDAAKADGRWDAALAGS
ncbi:YdeI family protein [Nocardioides sp. MH1]|uniref:YdeI/OmpD-associated family protein n=1 Tax=Nocardioides sp. MH1 TaxID=3242490 RepID=UPI003520E558